MHGGFAHITRVWRKEPWVLVSLEHCFPIRPLGANRSRRLGCPIESLEGAKMWPVCGSPRAGSTGKHCFREAWCLMVEHQTPGTCLYQLPPPPDTSAHHICKRPHQPREGGQLCTTWPLTHPLAPQSHLPSFFWEIINSLICCWEGAIWQYLWKTLMV